MTQTIPGVMGFVVRELKARPEVSTRELYDRSLKRYPEVGDLTVRQFHARYPLQARKQLNAPVVRRFPVPRAEPPPAPPPVPEEPATPPREAVRLLLFRLAMDLETAHSRAELVDFVAGIDRYVDEAMRIGAPDPRRRAGGI